MDRPDAIFYTLAFYSYLAAFAGYIIHVALKKEMLGKISTIVVSIGAIPHAVAFIMRWVMKGNVPLANMYEYMGLMSLMVVLGSIYFAFRFKNHKLGVVTTPVSIVLLVVASLLPAEINRQLMPALQSNWLAIHVSMAALGSGAFLLAFAASTIYLLTEKFDNVKLEQENTKRLWTEFSIFWVGLPVIIAGLLSVIGILPKPVDPSTMMQNTSSAITIFAFKIGETGYYWGRQAIGLGIGMIIGAIVWSFVGNRNADKSSRGGGRFFTVIVMSLLFGAVITGFLMKGGFIQLTSRSYFKIFEFFGPTLFFSWLLTYPMYILLVRMGGGWINSLGIPRNLAEDISYSAVSIGYPLYTIGALFAGAIWAEQAWGTWWSWDPKEVGALVIWLFYTGFLHARYQKQWKSNRAQVLIVFGMVMVFISFFGNYFFGGMHSFEVT